VAVGTDVALSVTVTNTASLPIGARWLFNGTSAGTNFLSNTFTAVLNLTNVQTTSAGRWSALVTNEGPIAASAFMSALANLTVVVSPTNQTVLAGANVTLSSLAAGPATIRYQWQHAGTNLPNATNPNLTLSGVREADAGLYTVVITNANGQATGFSATLNVIVPQLTLGQPRHVAPGRFEMVVTGLISQQQYAIDVSTNLVAWSALTTFTATNSTVPLADETAGSASQRFYRARSMP
jgi:hypothetical protein